MNALSNVTNADLHHAFEQFNNISEQFTHAYQDLESRFRQIKLELSDTKSKRLSELAEKERLANRMHLLLMALPMGVLVLDKEGVVQECNKSASELLDTPLRGQIWSDVLASLFPDSLEQNISSINIKGRNLHFISKSISDSKDSLVLINDVTDPVTHIDSVKRKERLAFLGNAIASIAHDIRTPLAASFLNLSNLDKKIREQSPEECIRVIEKVRLNLKSLENTINSMLIYAKGGADTFELMNCKKCCELIASDLFEIFPAISFTIHADENLKNKYVKINFSALMTSFRNLISNSQAVCPSETEIKIKFSIHNQNKMNIVISDNGPGIAKTDVGKIFEPFYTTRKNGTGLGLSIVKSIVNSHMGDISVIDSNQGATFSLNVPIEHEVRKIEGQECQIL